MKQIASGVNSSATSFETDTNCTDENSGDAREISIWEVVKQTDPVWLAVIGFFCSIVASMQLPLFGYILSRYVFLLAIDINTEEGMADFIFQRNMWAAIFCGLCFGIGLSSGFQKLTYGLGGENVTFKLRVDLFKAILNKHVGWFDDAGRAPGVLSNMISEEINAVNGLTTESIGIIFEAIIGLVISCAFVFFFSWQLALVTTAVSPFMVLGGLGMSKL